MTGSRAGCAAAAAIFLAACGVYLSTLSAGFAIDDGRIIVGNPLISRLEYLPDLFRCGFWDQDAGGEARTWTDRAMKASYRPLTVASFNLNFAGARLLAGPPACAHCRAIGHTPAALAPWSYHLANLLLHGLVSVLVFVVAGGLGVRPAAAVAAGLVFALHPVHVDAVAWVTQRGELLAAGWSLTAWYCHLRGGRLRWCGPVLYLLGLLSKETCLGLPLLVAGSDVYLGRFQYPWAGRGAGAGAGAEGTGVTGGGAPGARPAVGWAVYVAYALAVGLYLLARRLVLGGLEVPTDIRYFSGVSSLVAALTVARFMVTQYAWGFLGGRVATDCQRPAFPDAAPDDPVAWLALGALGGLLVFSVVGWARRRPAAAALGVVFCGLLPVSHLLARIGVLGAGRLLYVPSIGVALGLGGLIGRSWERGGRGGRVAVAGLLLALGAATAAGARQWHSQLTAADRTLGATPDNPLGMGNRAVALAEAGQPRAARALLERAMRLDPSLALLWYNYALVLIDLTEYAAARAALDRAQALDVDPPVLAHLGRARILDAEGKRPEARREIEAALALDDRSTSAWMSLGEWELAAGNPAAALAAMDRALPWILADGGAELQVGLALRRLGRTTEAGIHLRRATELWPASELAWNGLGLGLEHTGAGGEADAAYRRAIALRAGWADGHQNLGVLLRTQGRVAEAIAEFRSALAAQPGLAEAHAGLAGLLEAEAPREALEHLRSFLAAAQARPELARMIGPVQRRIAVIERRLAGPPPH
ncbi:MAG: tetratricopeptide repeat protein [Planctomycetes bacterium]|nr:tetratricopeptide repeat protein [Planctomycetota bacterium]